MAPDTPFPIAPPPSLLPSQLIPLLREGDCYADGFEMIPLDSRNAGFGGRERFALLPRNPGIITPKSESGERSYHTMF